MKGLISKFFQTMLLVASLLLISLGAQASDCQATTLTIEEEMLSKTFFLGCNMHLAPSASNNWGNAAIKFDDGTFIPWGSMVRVGRITTNKNHGGVKVHFENLLTGKIHRYIVSKEWAEAEPAIDHLYRVFLFDSSVVRKQVKAMSEINQKGIKEGHALPGMSKEAALIALGYPPANLTADPMAMDNWHYMRNENESFAVLFGEGGKVVLRQE